MGNVIKGVPFIRGNGSPLTPLQHSENIFKQYLLGNYFSTLTGQRGSGKPIIIDNKLFAGRMTGDQARYHFIPQVYGDGIEGQNASITGNEDTLDEYFMDIRIDQIAKAFAKKGKMTTKRCIWDFRSEASAQLKEWFRHRLELDLIDALTGVITDGCTRLTGGAENSTALVSGEGRCIRADYANSKFTVEQVKAADTSTSSLLGTLATTDVMNTQLLDVLQDFAKTANEKYAMKPIRAKNGEEYYMLVITPKDAINLRSDPRWEKRALAAMTGKGSLEGDPIATGALGVWEHIIVREANFVKTHQNAEKTLKIARNLLLGADAAVLAYGQTFDYSEEFHDHKRILSIAGDEIRGMKKITFDGVDLNCAQVITSI